MGQISSHAISHGSIDDIPASQKAAPVFIYDPRDFTELADAVMALGILTGNPSGGVKVAARLTASVNGVRRILSPINKKNYPDSLRRAQHRSPLKHADMNRSCRAS